jgi:very-short-patch-repair endonuclease
MTLPEILLWMRLKGKAIDGLKFRRQHPLGSYILDFFCADRRLAVEVDGQAHDRHTQIARDAVRDAWLAEHGVQVLRLRAQDVLNDLDNVVLSIASAAKAGSSTPRRTWME